MSLAQYEETRIGAGNHNSRNDVSNAINVENGSSNNFALELEAIKLKMVALEEEKAREDGMSTVEMKRVADLEADKVNLEKEVSTQNYMLQLLNEKMARREACI